MWGNIADWGNTYQVATSTALGHVCWGRCSFLVVQPGRRLMILANELGRPGFGWAIVDWSERATPLQARLMGSVLWLRAR